MRFLVALFAMPLFAVTYPTLPTATVDATCCPPITRTVATHTAAQLQAAFSSARYGDNILLDAGVVYQGNFILYQPTGGNGNWVTVSTTRQSSLPSPGTRVGAGDAVNMAKIMSPDYGGPGDWTAPALANNYNSVTLSDMGINGYRFIGIEFATGLSALNYHVIYLSPMNTSGQSSPASQPSNIILDRCLMHGNDPISTTFPNGTAYLNGSVLFDVANSAIVDSYLYNLWGIGVETQAISCGGGAGPRLIQNNEISGGTEGFMCGGGTLPYSTVIPTDITVVHNYFTRPAAWQTSSPVGSPAGFTSVPYSKNLFELKVGQRVRFTDNVLENSWDVGSGQHGTAITLVPRPYQDSNNGAVPAIFLTDVDDDILIANNVARQVGGFISTQQYDDVCISASVVCAQSARELVVNNMADFDTAYYASGVGISAGSMQDFSVKRNTLLGTTGAVASTNPSLFANREICSQTFGTNFEWSYNINLNGVEGDCEYDPANVLISSWLGTVSTVSNLVANVSGLNLAAWQAFGNGSQIATTLASIGLAPNELTMQQSSPWYGSGIGANLSCFNEAAIRAGTPSPLCPLPPEVQTGVPQAPQVITFGALSNVTYSATPVMLTASASSGLPVSFSSATPAICTVSGTTLTLVSAGTCSVSANQMGNSAYAAATSVVQTFSVTLGSPPVILSPAFVTFPNQTVNTPSSAQLLTVTNKGPGWLSISSIAIAGTNPSDFAQINNCPVGPATLAPNGTCTINVTFTPSAASMRSAAISITDSAAGSPQSVALSGTGIASVTQAWPNGYMYQATFTVAAGQVPSAQTNYPALISGTFADFATTANGGRISNTCTQTVGNNATTVPCDLIFTSDAAGTMLLNWEFETYAAANGAVNIWVNAPNLSNGTVIYAWYGQPTVTMLQTTPTGTWSNNFLAVYHMKENPAGTAPQLNDSTVNGNNATMNGPVAGTQQQPGEIDGSVNFEGNTWAGIANPGNFSFERTDSFSLSGWFKAASNSAGTLLSKLPTSGLISGWALMQYTGSTNPTFSLTLIGTSASNNAVVETPAVSTGTWHYVVATYSGTSSVAGINIYVDGVNQPLTTLQNTLTTTIVNAVTPAINGRAGPNHMTSDSMDEIRVSTKGVVFSPAWVTASFNNQSHPATFFTAVTGLTNP